MMMGVDWKLYWLSWFTTHFTFAVCTAIGLALVGSYVFSFSSAGIMFVYFTLYLTSVITFSYALSALFSTSRRATVVGAVVYQLTVAPAMTATAMYPDGSVGWMWSMLLPSGSIYIWGEAIRVLEEGQIGITPSTLNTPICDDYKITPNTILGMTAGTIFIYAVLAYYLECVFPSQYGQKLVPWFFLLPSYWKGEAPKADADDKGAESEAAGLAGFFSPTGAGSRLSWMAPTLGIEPVAASDAEDAAPEEAKVVTEAMGADEYVAIVIRRLTKRFGRGKLANTAVKALSLEMAEGHITALLGGNGAGKTTTISMLTGLITMSGGGASIYGHEVATEMGKIRRSLGVCPQFDTLWLRLTVREHLMLYGVSRGLDRVTIADMARPMLASVGMEHKTNETVSSLSGGQKRKLSLLIALLGDPRTVFLDEPTSGMDPYSRRLCWKVLRAARKHKAMVLTTHFMDEVDVLADRCAIMTEGELVCVGSTSFLKSYYGVGYHMDLEVCPDAAGLPPAPAPPAAPAADEEDAEVDQPATGLAHRAALLRGIFRRHVPRCEFRSADGNDADGGTAPDALAAAVAEASERDVVRVRVALPKEDVRAFPDLLRELQRSVAAGELGTVNYGLSCTTLDDVFLRTSSTARERMAAMRAASEQKHGLTVVAPSPMDVGDGGYADDPQVTSTPLVGSPAAGGGGGGLFDGENGADPMAAPMSSTPLDHESFVKLTGLHLRVSQLVVLMWKRVLNFKRDMPTILFQLVRPGPPLRVPGGHHRRPDALTPARP